MTQYARIVDNKVEELFPTLPDFHPDFVATLVEVADAVEVGMVRKENGSFAFPAPNPDAAILAQIAALEALQTPRLLREAMKKKACVVNKPGTIIHGLAPDDAVDAIDTALDALRAQLTVGAYYQVG